MRLDVVAVQVAPDGALTLISQAGEASSRSLLTYKPCHRGDGPQLGRRPRTLGFGVSNTDHPSLGVFVGFGLM